MLEYASQGKFNKHSGEIKLLRNLKKYKRCITVRLILKGKSGKKTLLTNFLVLTCGFRYFWKWGNIRKSVRWKRRLRLLCTLWIGVSRKFQLHFTLMFQLRYYKMVQSLGMQKLVSKITWIWTSHKQWKAQKVQNWCAFVQKKDNIPLAKIYTVDSSTITFNYLCVESPNYLPFLKP